MSQNKPKVSIALPVYNGEIFLKEALDSILCQTFTDFELIISDNASTDSTQEICKVYASQDKRIRYYRNTENLGAAWNFNQVFKLSRGKYFKWACYDDVIAPTFLARCVEVLDNDPSVVLCHSQTVLIDENKQEIPFDTVRDCFIDRFGKLLDKPDCPRRWNSWKPHERFVEVLESHWCWEGHGLMRAEQLKKTSLHGGFIGSDKVLLAELSLMGHFALILEPLFFYRRHSHHLLRLESPREGLIWINPKASNKLRSSRLLCVHGYLQVALKSELSWYERICCVIVLGHWLVKLENWQRFIGYIYCSNVIRIQNNKL
jgi:glycosyltransferase involved in cell wall biosynthesis